MTRIKVYPEKELVCPTCRATPLAVHPPRCACGWEGSVTDLIFSGRSRVQQFPVGKFPHPAPFR